MKGSEGAESKVNRGEVYLLDLSREAGRLKKERPVVVIQNDIGNVHSSETIVAAVRDRQRGGMLPIFVPVGRGTGGLKKDSLIDTGHLATVGKVGLGRKLGTLPPRVMAQVDEALKISLDLI